MARTNYQHGKRLRELAKKQKREEKAARRKERKESGAPAELELAENTLLTERDAFLAEEAEATDEEKEETSAAG